MDAKTHDEIKAELIRMRKYVMHHSIPIGECVAWCKLKRMFDVGNKDADDWEWLKQYESRLGEKDEARKDSR